MKLIEKLKMLYVKHKVKQMSKVAFVLENNYERWFLECGAKTYGRLNPMKAAQYVMAQIYGINYERKLELAGICFTEDENVITMQVWLTRPGMLIGKMGCLIDSLEKSLTEVYGKPTKVRITETEKMYGFSYINIL